MREQSLEKYKIKRFTEETDILPEETLIDSLSAHSAIEVPISHRVFNLIVFFILGIFLFFISRAFQLQIIKGGQFLALAEQASGSTINLSPIRGIIFDTKGKPMTKNVPVFDIIAVKQFMPKSKEEIDKNIEEISKIIEKSSKEISDIFEKNKNTGIFIIKSGLGKEEVIKLNEQKAQGIFVVTNSRRNYPDGPASAHILGYTGIVSQENLEKDGFYGINDRIGKLGIELQYESNLRGKHRLYDFNNPSDEEESNADNLFLSIDNQVQLKLYESMISVFKSAGVKRGAAIAQDPRTGALVGLVSLPSFDNNLFENTSIKDNQKPVLSVLNDPNQPLINRSISGRYSPGSTIKPLLALAGLKEGTVTPETLVYADGSINIKSEVNPNAFFTFRDWKIHGWTDIRKAISDSVDIYFYALGGGYKNIDGLGIEKISEYLKMFGADKKTGIDLPGEISGFVPTKQWKKETRGEGWYIGDTYNISIGQGDLTVTPIWINTYISAIANGGKIMKPYIIKEISTADGKLVKKIDPQIVNEIPLDPEDLKVIREGMLRTVKSGTATLLKDLPVSLAAKTGTAQISGRGLNSLFSVYGPQENPEISVTILVENINQSQGLAIRVAKDFLEWYFKEYPKLRTQNE